MAFIVNGDVVLAFADSSDVESRDQRLFEANEGITDEQVDDACIAATTRILGQIQATSWWRSYYIQQDPTANITAGNGEIWVPAPQARYFRARVQDWRDACVYFALFEYILPKVADFGNPESAERQKIDFYLQRYNSLFRELIDAGDWYDFDADGTVEMAERAPTALNLARRR